jgi:general secretion pathway protein F
MPFFSYKAINSSGETVTGSLDTGDELGAVRKLQEQGLMPLEVYQGDPKKSLLDIKLFSAASKRGFAHKKLIYFTRELATLLDAGMTLDRSLQILIELSDDQDLTLLIGEIRENVHSGSTFSDALKSQGGDTFPILYVSMVKAGEAGGALQDVLVSLADYLERTEELRDSVRSALIYPALLLAVAGISVAVLLMFVVPQFQQMFDDMGKALPVSTQIVIFMGNLLRDYWWLMLGGFFVLVAVIKKMLADPVVRSRWDKRILTMPLLGELFSKIETARFTRTLATLLENGLPVQKALQLAREVIKNREISSGLKTAIEKLERGGGLSGPLTEGRVLPPLALQMIKVGEESGSLETMLKKVANVYDGEVKTSIKRVLTMLEPILIIGLGIIVAGIIISILMAILGANELAF